MGAHQRSFIRNHLSQLRKAFSKGQKSWNLEHSQMLNPSAELAAISHSDVGEPYQQQSPEKFISRRRNIAQSEKRVGL
jgi:hypothetical protein